MGHFCQAFLGPKPEVHKRAKARPGQRPETAQKRKLEARISWARSTPSSYAGQLAYLVQACFLGVGSRSSVSVFHFILSDNILQWPAEGP